MWLFWSCHHRENKELIKQLSSPTPGSTDLYFPTRFPQNGWEQFKACLWKQCLSYWRSPSYNLTRIIFMSASSLLFGVLFWQKGKKMSVNTILLMLAYTTKFEIALIYLCKWFLNIKAACSLFIFPWLIASSNTFPHENYFLLSA